jgi:all-trans-8'-apo-beta-carotenal 15,15'-oxygenase
MATLTDNLFWGQGEADHRLAVTEGQWPTDMAGWVFIVGPDKRGPGGHWFDSPGLLCRIDCAPGADGRVAVTHRRIHTPLERLGRRWPKLFRSIKFVQVSPFGFTNMANTNVEPIDGRLFVGFDAGRPVEVDPATLEYLTPVGRTSEWMQGVGAPVEPLTMVAAHPAAAHDERAMYFVNYAPMPPLRPSVARWALNGPVERWPVAGMDGFDSIHDVKVSRDHLVISDLPFVVDPDSVRGKPRSRPNQDHTRLWIVAKDDLRRTAPGQPVPSVTVDVPMPTGHLSVDWDNPAGEVTVYLEHIPLADLMMQVGPDTISHATGGTLAQGYHGMVPLSVQPGVVGRYRIDTATGEVLDADVASDDRFWGGVLATRDDSTSEARSRRTRLWYAGTGYDPDLVTRQWWDLYVSSGNTAVVGFDDLPVSARPGALASFDLDTMKVDAVYEFASGAFPSPPTFVPRTGSDRPGDGYVVVVVHQAGSKELQVFDASDIERGPVARATSPTFNPSLLLHSCWMPQRTGPRPSNYRVPFRRDVAGALRGIPRFVRSLGPTGRAIASQVSGRAR